MKLITAFISGMVLMGAVSPAGATLLTLTPGGGCAPPQTSCPAVPINNGPLGGPGSTLVASTGLITGIQDINGSTLQATLDFEEQVYRTAGGTLDFFYQFQITGISPSSHTNQLIASGFTGFTTKAGYVCSSSTGNTCSSSSALNLPGFPSPFSSPPKYDAPNGVFRSTNGSDITFRYILGTPNVPMLGMDTYILEIDTNATSWTTSTIQLVNSGTATVQGFAPSPEPGAIVLFGTVLVLGAVVLRRKAART